MDILDIDEALKDDSFIFLEDKTHDDVSNILQQWKSNNSIQQQEQDYKLNSRTFTRPKRKSAQNLESQFSNQQPCNGAPPMLNVQIGGLVTTFQKSFLQDTSPPPSVCSSIDVSMDRMNNSLITSADFANINFLQSGNALEFSNEHLRSDIHLFNKSTNAGYTLSDMIRDRKALESLTLSGDGTLIKDCNIGQIDDMSITLSKTTSSCSTMDNSTESVEASNRTIESAKENKYSSRDQVGSSYTDMGFTHTTHRLSSDNIGNTTINLVENSICNGKELDKEVDITVNTTHELKTESRSADETFKKPTRLNETIAVFKADCTFDCQPYTPETQCATPEGNGIGTKEATLQFCESTPHAGNVKYSRKQYTPSIKEVDMNISPIVAPTAKLNVTRVLSDTFENGQIARLSQQEKINSQTFSHTLPPEVLENESYAEEICSNNSQKQRQCNNDDVAMQNVLNLAQAEADLLAANKDEEFEHMLDEFSKVELNPEQLKMKKSVDSIKKRFNYGLAEKHERELSREAKDMREKLRKSCEEQLDELEGYGDIHISTNSTTIMRRSNLQKIRESDSKKSETSSIFESVSGGSQLREVSDSPLVNSKESPREIIDPPSLGLSLSGSSSSGERLLSRRSRLYDDINITSVSLPTTNSSPGCSNITQEINVDLTVVKESSEGLSSNPMPMQENHVKSADSKDALKSTDKNSRRLFEKRDRDRDRFKTIVKERTFDGVGESGPPLNVPCIDDMPIFQPEETADLPTEMVPTLLTRYSRRDHDGDPALVNVANRETNTNYLTYKKPKDKSICKNLPEIASEDSRLASVQTRISSRSLSRPRYISGLQKFTVVSKATSAGDLGKASALTVTTKPYKPANSVGINSSKVLVSNSKYGYTEPSATTAKGNKELKSPMGIKSKSFHNLSSNFGAAMLTQRSSSYGLKKPTGVLTEKQANLNSTATQQCANTVRNSTQQEKCNETIFKVPRLVSGIRAPTGVRRAGLVRPSSGYYSLNVAATAKSDSQIVDIDIDAERHSPSDSMSSASSRSSGFGGKPQCSASKPGTTDSQLPTTQITQIITGPTGIPKPSGLRPPSNLKRSGLPRPASILKR